MGTVKEKVQELINKTIFTQYLSLYVHTNKVVNYSLLHCIIIKVTFISIQKYAFQLKIYLSHYFF